MGLGLTEIILLAIIFSPLIAVGTGIMGLQKGIKIRHKESGMEKKCYVGYSWTYYFFGFLVPITRGEISRGLFHLLFSLVTVGIFQLVMPFLYNKQASTRLLTSGWELHDTEENNAFALARLDLAFLAELP